jgi:protoporphyrinogen IX oxidase
MTAGSTSSPASRAAIALAVTVTATAVAILTLGSAAFSWVKAVHIIAVISWMAGMLYLPRLFVYHCDAAPGSELAETFKVMERRLLTIIINPAMIVTWVLGLWMAWDASLFTAHWFHAKLLLALAMSGMHGYLSLSVRRFRDDRNTLSARQWRMLNEVPTILMIGIVVLVVIKPF